MRAAPAAVARIFLGWRSEPHIRRLATAAEKAMSIIGSIALGIVFGELARHFPGSAPHADLVVIAVAFNAQHVATRAIAASNPTIAQIEKEARKRIPKRFIPDDRDD